jgi:AmpE protein
MIFLAMIIALGLLHLGAASAVLQRDQWFLALQSGLRGVGLSKAATNWLSVITPVLLTAVVFDAVESWLFGLFWIAGAVVVLLYSFGRIDSEVFADEYRSYCHSGDFQGAYLHAQSHWELENAGENLTTPEAVHGTIQRELLYAGYQRWFPVLFYFLLLGPAGALLYRLLQLACVDPGGRRSGGIVFYADWVPVRLLSAGFALAGDFLSSRDTLLSAVSDSDAAPRDILFSVGRAATGRHNPPLAGDDFATSAATEVSDLSSLVARSSGVWLVGVSLIVVFA